MLSRFSDALQSAADVLAPPATRLEDFEYHWRIIVNFYQSYNECSTVHVEETKLPYHLHQMLQLLVDEEKEQQEGTVGVCLEALVSRSVGVVDALPMLARADRPPGARALALNTATQLLRRIRQPCINSPTVYRPLQRMLVQCNESPASPTEKEEVELLLTLCGLVRKEPGLANIFTTPFVEDETSQTVPDDIQKLIPIKTKSRTPRKNTLFEIELPPDPMRNVSIIRMSTNGKEDCCSNAANSSAAEDNGSNISHKTVCEDNEKFLLIDLLLSYLNSADKQVVLRACEGIMIVSSLPEDDIANLVTSCSPLCETLINKLVDKYRTIPSDVDQADVDHLNITWAYVAQDFAEKPYKFHGYRELTSFFSWLDYCDTLMKECHPSICTHLARTFRQSFLEGVAEAGVADVQHAAVVTAVITKCLKAIDSTELLHELSNWLVGEPEDEEWPLLHTLLSNCLTDQHDITLETLRFFETLIEKGTEHSIHRLVLSRVCSRGYCTSFPRPPTPLYDDRDRLNDIPLWRERESNREAMKQLQHEEHVTEQINGILSHEGLSDRVDDDAAHHIHRVINSFLLLLPRAILSDPVGSDYEHYIHDAHRHYQMWLDMTGPLTWMEQCSHNWPDTTASSTHSYDSRPEADVHVDHFHGSEDKSDGSTPKFTQPLEPNTRDTVSTESITTVDAFDEGPFFSMLYKLLLNMPSQPYQVNLHLTSIISKLALIPHPCLHEYILNPLLNSADSTRTLFKVLQQIAARLTMEIPRLKNYKKLIENTRLHLMSEDPSYDVSGDHNQLVESLIVLEEFCKELAAIAFVKYQHSAMIRR